MKEFFSGKKLYGDDFAPSEIEAWFKDEEDGYFNLLSSSHGSYEYGYNALNMEHGFRFLPDGRFDDVLGVGSAYGREFMPIADKCSRITILEPSEDFQGHEVGGVPVDYIKPRSDGILPFKDASFNLITCFGVLHHIPNVSAVINELYRCLRPKGYLLLREPINSMGDWRFPRKGLTKRERGIPIEVFSGIIIKAGFKIIREKKCAFSLTSRLKHVMKRPVYNSAFAVLFDSLLCSFPFWPDRYHPDTYYHKLRPTSVFFVLIK